jgi:hypothetical protein
VHIVLDPVSDITVNAVVTAEDLIRPGLELTPSPRANERAGARGYRGKFLSIDTDLRTVSGAM